MEPTSIKKTFIYIQDRAGGDGRGSPAHNTAQPLTRQDDARVASARKGPSDPVTNSTRPLQVGKMGGKGSFPSGPQPSSLPRLIVQI